MFQRTCGVGQFSIKWNASIDSTQDMNGRTWEVSGANWHMHSTSLLHHQLTDEKNSPQRNGHLFFTKYCGYLAVMAHISPAACATPSDIPGDFVCVSVCLCVCGSMALFRCEGSEAESGSKLLLGVRSEPKSSRHSPALFTARKSPEGVMARLYSRKVVQNFCFETETSLNTRIS